MIRVVTAEEVSSTAAERWREQYSNWEDADTFADGTTKKSTNDALNKSKHTPANIKRILNDTWSHPQCYACAKRVNKVVEIQENWGDEVIALCPECLDAASKLIE